jgi:hypothetical protein
VGWLRNQLHLVDNSPRPTPRDDFEMAVRITEAVAATDAGAELTRAQAEEAQRLFGMIRREINIAQVSREVSSE